MGFRFPPNAMLGARGRARSAGSCVRVAARVVVGGCSPRECGGKHATSPLAARADGDQFREPVRVRRENVADRRVEDQRRESVQLAAQRGDPRIGGVVVADG